MDTSTKRQLVGAAVLVALAVVFLPMLFTSGEDSEEVDVPVEVPPRPDDASKPEQQRAGKPPAEGEEPPQLLEEGAVDMEERASAPTKEEGPGERGSPPAEAEQAEEGQVEERAASSDPAPQPDSGRESAGGEPGEGPASDIEAVSREEGAYAVQVGSFRQRENAVSERDRLRGADLPTYLQEAEVGGETRYRVRLGPVMEREEAEALLERAAEELDAEGYVVAR